MYAASSVSCGSVDQVCGTHWVNIDITCAPSGASVGSSVDGTTVSQNGRSAARPSRASWKARSMYSSEWHSSNVPE